VRAARGLLEGIHELGVRRVGGIVAAHAPGDVLGGYLDREAARLFAPAATADAVGHHGKEGDPVGSGRQRREVGKAAAQDGE
jgi:hypothetical protein